MSIEAILLDLTSAINGLTKAIESTRQSDVTKGEVVLSIASLHQEEADTTAKKRGRKAKSDDATPEVVAAPVATAPSMPAPPAFEPVVEPVATPEPVVSAPVAEAPTAPSVNVPFSDAATLMEYVMATYYALGEGKGAEIQNVLLRLGVSNINDVRPDLYEEFYRGVEALKGN